MLKMVVPKGRMYERIKTLLEDAGIRLRVPDRGYRPTVSDPDIEVKIMKPQNIARLVELGAHDIGFTGHDWVTETGSDIEDLMDLGFDPVRIVSAVPGPLKDTDLKSRKIIVASEYEKIAKDYLDREGYNYVFLRTFGATEVFPPEDADMIIDNTSTGKTLRENDLHIIDDVMRSSTRVVANKAAMADPEKREKIEKIIMLFRSILDARERVMLEMNVPSDSFEEILQILPSMRSPTVAKLYGEEGYAVKVAIKKDEAASLIPILKEKGASDILEYSLRKVVG